MLPRSAGQQAFENIPGYLRIEEVNSLTPAPEIREALRIIDRVIIQVIAIHVRIFDDKRLRFQMVKIPEQIIKMSVACDFSRMSVFTSESFG